MNNVQNNIMKPPWRFIIFFATQKSTNMSTVSPAGNWGETTNKLTGLGSLESAHFLSVTQDNYGYKACKEEKEKQNNKYAKFVSNLLCIYVYLFNISHH